LLLSITNRNTHERWNIVRAGKTAARKGKGGMIDDKTFFFTGATGSFGREFFKQALQNHKLKAI